jgi:hypothetical protein
MRIDRDDPERRPAAYVGTIVANIVFLWFVNSVAGWDWRFITDDFPAVLWAIYLSIGFQIAGNALLLFFHPRFLHHTIQALLDVVSLLALIVLVTVFPFDFAGAGDLIAKVVLSVAIGGTVIGTVVNLLKAIGAVFGRRT